MVASSINWHDTTGTPSKATARGTTTACSPSFRSPRRDIPSVVDLSEEATAAVDYMFAEYGRTPNPDAATIPFDVFLKEAVALGPILATGHYCRRGVRCGVSIISEHYRLLAGVDGNKQSFLRQLSVEQLSRALFRRGPLSPEVRRSTLSSTWLRPGARDRRCVICRFAISAFAIARTTFRHWPSCGATPRDGKKIGDAQRGPFLYGRPAQGAGDRGRRESLFVLATVEQERRRRRGRRAPGSKGALQKAGCIDRPRRADAGGQRRRFRVRIRYRQPLQGAELVVCDGYLLFDEARVGRHARPVRRLVRRETLVGSGVPTGV